MTIRGDAPAKPAVPSDAVTASGSGLDPAISPAYAREEGAGRQVPVSEVAFIEMTERGTLRVYLGAAPGVGKTYAMLAEGHRRAQRGSDVVVAFVEPHGRRHTVEMIGDLPVVPRRILAYRGSEFDEMDLAAVLARRPQIALVDELAHTNVPGSQHTKRWQDIEQLLEAGIHVISTVNVQHLESLNDVVEAITGVPQRETVPDSVVRAAEQVELVDMTAEALRRRMAHGNIYNPDKIDAALSNYFRPGNLTALRELALLWLADSVDEGLQRYREQHGIAARWETRERVVVALTGGPEGEALIRRAARIAGRATGGFQVSTDTTRPASTAVTGWPVRASQRWTSNGCSSSHWAGATTQSSAMMWPNPCWILREPTTPPRS